MKDIGFSYTASGLRILSFLHDESTFMSGETSLNVLLRSMSPALNPGEYVFCSVADAGVLAGVEVVGSFREGEGLSVILRRHDAQSLGLDCAYVMAWITLTVHSSLQAVGLTAAFASALGEAGISCNVVAGFYHDHLFVGKDDAHKALDVLSSLARDAH
jgi:hypothetical protein